MSVETWAMLGTWAAGVGSFAAAGVALWVSHKGDIRRDHEREDELAGQARLVHSTASRAQPSFVVSVRNDSSEPIWAVRVVGLHLHDEVGARVDDYSWSADGLAWDRIEPHSTVDQMTAIRVRGEPVLLVDLRWRVSVDVEYVDARGVRWRRWGHVQPRRSPISVVNRDPAAVPEPVERDE